MARLSVSVADFVFFVSVLSLSAAALLLCVPRGASAQCPTAIPTPCVNVTASGGSGDNSPECDDGNPCTLDLCQEHGSVAAGTGCCQHFAAPVDSDCDNGIFCDGLDACNQVGQCVPRGSSQPCNFALPTCLSACDEASRECRVAVGTACDDGDWCTVTDRCDGTGLCVGTGSPCGGGAADFCNNTCDSARQTCARPAGDACDDGDSCTKADRCNGLGLCAGSPMECNRGECLGSCVAGACVFAGGLPCPDDGNLCTDDRCDSSGICTHVANTSLTCNDGRNCTEGDQCQTDGLCYGKFNATICGVCGVDNDCDDGNPCTFDSCSLGNCTHANNNSLSCDDGLFCTGRESCFAGVCVHAGDPCSGSNSTCNNTCSESSRSCATAANYSCLDDGLFCNGPEVCDGAGACLPTGDPCSSGSLCTRSCNESATTCFAPAGLTVNDGEFCNGADSCDGVGNVLHAGDPCSGSADPCQRICSAGSGTCGAPDGITCDNGAFCDGLDACISGVCISIGGGCNVSRDCCAEGANLCIPLATGACAAISSTSSSSTSSSSVVGTTTPAQTPPQVSDGTSSAGGLDTIILIVIGVALFAVLLLVAIVILLYLRKQRGADKSSETSDTSSGHSGDETVLARLARAAGGNEAQSRAGDANLLGDIDISEQLGLGAYGEVYFGVHHRQDGDRDVALKRLVDEEVFKEFIAEGETLKALDHKNVVGYFGVYVSEAGDTWLVTEFCNKGSVLDLVKDKDSRVKYTLYSEKGQQILIDVCRQLANGMSYLAAEKFIHRDLAARNVLIHEETADGPGKFCAKVADFGLARSSADYYVASSSLFAVKWAAPEVLEFKRFSTASDVFAFAVTCWEILTLGSKPWGKLSNEEAGERILAGDRVGPFQSSSKTLSEFLTNCMAEDPDDRPNFEEIAAVLTEEVQKFGLRSASVANFKKLAPETVSSGDEKSVDGEVSGEASSDSLR